jgi:hypothetical protein
MVSFSFHPKMFPLPDFRVRQPRTGGIARHGLQQIASFMERDVFGSDTFILAVVLAIRRITGVIEKLTFLFARRTLLGGSIFIKRISAIGTFPAGHWDSSLPALSE